MRKLVAGTFLTLDGVMQAPGGPDEDRESGFKYGGWMAPFFDEKGGAIMTDWIKRAGGLKLGEVGSGTEPVVVETEAEVVE